MIPFPIYLTSVQDNLLAGFEDFRREVALYVGYGADSSQWTADQTAELNRDVQEAYRWCLYPASIPGERVPHTWTFLELTTTLSTTSGTWQYTLPADFGSFIDNQLYWPVNSGYAPIVRVSDVQILQVRQWSNSSGQPEWFALRWKAATAGSQQRQELILWPTPDASYTLTYKYAVLTDALGTTNKFPLGGPRMTQLMFEACKAIGEVKKNGARGEQWNLFMDRLKSAIELDKGTNTPRTLGRMHGGYGQSLNDYVRTGTYKFGPSEEYGPTLYQEA